MATAKQAARSGRNTFRRAVREHLEQAAKDGEAVTDAQKKGLKAIIDGEWTFVDSVTYCVGVCGEVMPVSHVWSTPGKLRLSCPKCCAKAKEEVVEDEDEDFLGLDDLLKVDDE